MKTQDSPLTQSAPMTTEALEEALPRVWQALNGKEYDWRSAAGIAKETNLPISIVSNILELGLGEKVVRSVSKDNPGEYLYASRDRYNKIRGPWNRFLSLVTSQVK